MPDAFWTKIRFISISLKRKKNALLTFDTTNCLGSIHIDRWTNVSNSINAQFHKGIYWTIQNRVCKLTSRFLVYKALTKIFCFLYFNQTVYFVIYTKHIRTYFTSIKHIWLQQFKTNWCIGIPQMYRTNIVGQNIFHIPILKFETVKSFYNLYRRKPVADKSF